MRPGRDGAPSDRRIRRSWWIFAGTFVLLGFLLVARLLAEQARPLDWIVAGLVAHRRPRRGPPPRGGHRPRAGPSRRGRILRPDPVRPVALGVAGRHRRRHRRGARPGPAAPTTSSWSRAAGRTPASSRRRSSAPGRGVPAVHDPAPDLGPLRPGARRRRGSGRRSRSRSPPRSGSPRWPPSAAGASDAAPQPLERVRLARQRDPAPARPRTRPPECPAVDRRCDGAGRGRPDRRARARASTASATRWPRR